MIMIHWKHSYFILITNLFLEKKVMIGKITFSKSHDKSVMVQGNALISLDSEDVSEKWQLKIKFLCFYF